MTIRNAEIECFLDNDIESRTDDKLDIETVKKIHSFKRLVTGWSYGEGKQFKVPVLNDAISLVEEAFNLSFHTTDTFPGLDGEVMCTIYHENHYLEFIIEPNGSITFTREYGDEEICYQEGLLLQEAVDKIRELRHEIH